MAEQSSLRVHCTGAVKTQTLGDYMDNNNKCRFSVSKQGRFQLFFNDLSIDFFNDLNF